jgi:hypothetical protein
MEKIMEPLEPLWTPRVAGNMQLLSMGYAIYGTLEPLLAISNKNAASCMRDIVK